MTDMTTHSDITIIKGDVADRNKKILASMGVGAFVGVAVTAVSPRGSLSSTIVTSAYAGVRLYLTHETMLKNVDRDARRAQENEESLAMSYGDMASTALGGLIDVTAAGFVSNFLLGN